MKYSHILTALLAAVCCSAPSLAGTVLIDGDTPATGSLLGTGPLVTPYGSVTFEYGEIRDNAGEAEFVLAGAAGNCFDILGPGDAPAGDQHAELSFDFDVLSASFIYGGNAGNILVEARDQFGAVVDSFFQASTDIAPAGPVTLFGPAIRSLWWSDTTTGMNFAILDNIELAVTSAAPAPGAIVLGAMGSGWVAWLRRRQAL